VVRLTAGYLEVQALRPGHAPSPGATHLGTRPRQRLDRRPVRARRCHRLEEYVVNAERRQERHR
jgi:hypothetical protein